MSPKTPSLKKIYNFNSLNKTFNENGINKLEYRFKYKLDGTQGGVYIDKNGIKTFSKNRWLTQDQDNGGFFQFILNNFSSKFEGLFNKYKVNNNSEIILLGEYIGVTGGKNYLKKLLQGETYFALFILKLDNLFIYDPETIKKIVDIDERIKTIPYIDQIFNIYSNEYSLVINEDNMGEIISNLEKEDSLLKEWFNISVPGEGLVGYPTKLPLSPDKYVDFMFKIKTSIYKLNTKANKLQNKVENYEDYTDFVNDFITENRLNQGFQEICESVYDIKLTGAFLTWIYKDVIDESIEEREKNNLTNLKLIHRLIFNKAKKWYFEKENEIKI